MERMRNGVLKLDPLKVVVLSLGREDRRVAEPIPDVIQSVVLLGTEHPPGDAVSERVRRDGVGRPTTL